jgi:hypothetical protein
LDAEPLEAEPLAFDVEDLEVDVLDVEPLAAETFGAFAPAPANSSSAIRRAKLAMFAGTVALPPPTLSIRVTLPEASFADSWKRPPTGAETIRSALAAEADIRRAFAVFLALLMCRFLFFVSMLRVRPSTPAATLRIRSAAYVNS